jgi:antitoxin VapB
MKTCFLPIFLVEEDRKKAMALNIKSRETEQVVRELARRTGLSITEAVHQAAAEKLRAIDEERRTQHANMTPEQREKLRRLEEIAQRVATLPVLDPRSADEILDYDEHGLPK